MRINTLSINTNLQTDKRANSFKMKKVTLCLCLLGALVIAGFRAPEAKASSQGCNQRACDQAATELSLVQAALCTLVGAGDPILTGLCLADVAVNYTAAEQLCNQCSP